MRFDETDRKILTLLQEDGRITMKKLGEHVHLSSPAVVERVRRLEEAGVITGYTAIVEPASIGLEMTATIIVTLLPNKKQGFLDYVRETPSIYCAHATPGKANAVIEVACANIHQFNQLIGHIQQFGETESFVHLDSYKSIGLTLDAITSKK